MTWVAQPRPAHKPWAVLAAFAGIALVVYGAKLMRRFSGGPKDFHGNPVNDPFMIKRGAAFLLVLLGAFMTLVLAPILWIA